ncbi:phage head closure protein [Brevibacillus agri]
MKPRKLWSDLVALVTVTPGEDEAGYPTDPVETRREVLANQKSVMRSEFYAAAQSGMKADVVFEIHAFEYNGETILEHGGKRYEVIRTFQATPEEIELTCSDLSQNGVM